jgi:hypothetical protein
MLNNIQTKLVRSLKSKKLNVFGLFFLLAFLILVVTKLSETYVETIPFNIEYRNLPEKNILTLDSIPKVNVTVSTHGFNLLSYYFYDKNFQLDFKKSTYIKDNNYVWLADKGIYDFKKLLGKNVDIIAVKPDTLILSFGTLSMKRVPVVLKSKINFASGFDTLDGIEIKPDSVNVIGAKEEIGNVDFVETQLLSLENIKTNINTNLGLELPNSSERLKLSEENINITASVEKFTEGTFDVPITILNVPNDIEVNYFPKYIKVSYYLSLRSYREVNLSDFMIECDYREVLKSGKAYFNPKLIVNSIQVKYARMKQNKVEYIIK